MRRAMGSRVQLGAHTRCAVAATALAPPSLTSRYPSRRAVPPPLHPVLPDPLTSCARASAGLRRLYEGWSPRRSMVPSIAHPGRRGAGAAMPAPGRPCSAMCA